MPDFRRQSDFCFPHLVKSRLNGSPNFFAAILLAFLSFACAPAFAGGAQIAIGNGKIGVGTISPATDVQVLGTITATTFSGDGSQLTSVFSLNPVSAKGTVAGNFALDLNKIDTADIAANVTVSLPSSGFISGFENKCVLDFSLASGYTLTPPTGVKWASGTAPTYSTLSTVRNVLTFRTRDGGTTWEADYSTYGGVETTFVQSPLSANGALGGDSFAVYTSAPLLGASYDAYMGADNNSSTEFIPTLFYGFNYTWYNPIALKVTSVSMTNRFDYGDGVIGYTLYASNDNSSWVTLTNVTNSTTAPSANWSIAVPSASQGFYKYYKLYVSSNSGDYYPGFTQATLNATYIAQ